MLAAYRILATLANEPIDRIEPAEPIEPTESTDPTDPIDRTEPTELIDSTEPFDRIESTEPVEGELTDPAPGSVAGELAEEAGQQAGGLLAGRAGAAIRRRNTGQYLLDVGTAAGPRRLSARRARLATAHER